LCSEENAAQVGQRISRLASKNANTDHINLLQSDTVEDVVNSTNITQNPPELIIIDSIQSIGSTQVTATPGTLSQIRASANLLIHLAKTISIPIILVGHVTKAGTLAGPKLLEHMVDVVLELEGDRHHDLRLLRGLKNRFGPTDETGIFSMTSTGLSPLSDPSAVFLSHRMENSPGSSLTLVMEGTRPLIVEIQALTVRSELAIPRRVPQGITQTRLQLICAILTKHLHLPLGESDVFVNVTGGMTIREPAADLAIALAILSSFKNVPLPPKSVAIGELGLLGEIRSVPYLEKRIKEAKTLGYTQVLDPNKYQHIKNITLDTKKGRN
jgi:DNA repair protein RadA/Sms